MIADATYRGIAEAAADVDRVLVRMGSGWVRMSTGYPEQTPYQVVTGEKQQWGATTYGLHGQRFNYLFHDGHVGIYRMKETVGSGTLNAPKGMWTMRVGD